MNKVLKESILWILILLPLVYLATMWHSLPEIIPTHFNFKGISDGWSHKSSLIIFTVALNVGIYFLMFIIPFIDPKKKIMQMGQKYYNLRFVMTFFIAVLSTFLIYTSNAGSIKNPNLLFGSIGVLVVIMGNYLTSIDSNYLIGIRTPWTLSSEKSWKKTHQLARPIWMIGGSLIVILGFIIPDIKTYFPIWLVIIAILGLVPIVYSYIVYRNDEES